MQCQKRRLSISLLGTRLKLRQQNITKNFKKATCRPEPSWTGTTQIQHTALKKEYLKPIHPDESSESEKKYSQIKNLHLF